MRKLMTGVFVAIFVAQFMIVALDDFNEENKIIVDDHDEMVKFAGRQSSGMNGNNSNVTGCNFTSVSDGFGGPVWQNGSVYYLNDIVEWPANSGHFWQMTFNGSNDPPESGGDWNGPCTCAQIAEESGIVWDATVNYDAWQIVEHNGSYWIAQDAGAPVQEEPGNEGASGAPSDFWVPCAHRSPCSTFDGHGGPVVWDSTASYSVNDTVEWPANSGQYWQSTTSGPTGEPSLNGKWLGPCSCKDIWESSTSVVWDSNSTYDSGMIVEFPGGSGDIWVAIIPSTTMGVDPTYPWADGNEWELCSTDDPTSGGPCASDVVGVWTNGTNVTSGEVYEYPANSGVLYVVNPGSPFWNVGAPDVDMDVWSPCDEIPSGDPCESVVVGVWNSSINVTSGEVYEYPANSGLLYVVNPGSPFWSVSAPDIDLDVWSPCEVNPPSGDPCESEVVGVWNSSMNVTSGEVYEYPANSGLLYVVNPGGPFWSVIAPDIDLDVWAPCEVNPPADTGPCNGSESVGVWNGTSVPVIGDVYEYPANSGMYYEIIFDHEGNISKPDGPGNEEFWSPIDCPCEESWVANGQAIWDATVDYPGNYVVAWPFGSNNLYVPLEPTGVMSGAEPGVDPHWIHCVDSTSEPITPAVTGPCNGSDSVGVWNSTSVSVIGDVYEYPANSGSYYEVIYVDLNGLISTAPGEDQDYEFWSPIDCTCEESWVANGQPVWDATVDYPGNYVVAWPFGSNNLYVPLEPTGVMSGAEPGVDLHWIHCVDPTPEPITPEETEDGWLPSIGVFGTVVAISMAVLITRRRI